jgi:hypothetical protein
MSVLNQIATARDDTFAARVALLLMKSAINIANEAPATANHANRLTLAQKHFRAQVNCKALAAAVIASNATIQSTIDTSPDLLGSNVPDNDLEFVINGLIDNFANAYV